MPTPTSHDEYLSRRYFSSLDVFRCGSILAVIWHHTQEGVAWLPASGRGFLGVDFFFVISGFLIVTLLLRERDREGFISLRRFYLRRTLRIFPVYYLLLGVLTAFFLFVKPHSRMAQPFFREFPYQALYLSNVAKNTTILFFTWSLATEEQFYLLWPPVEAWLSKKAVPILLGVIALNQCVNFGLTGGLEHVVRDGRNILQITFTPICLGVLVAHLLHDRGGFDRTARWLGRPWVPLALLGVLALACNCPVPDLQGWPRLAIQSSMALLLAGCVVREDHWLNAVFGSRGVRRVGVVSYGMYLYHMFTLHAANALLGRAAGFPLVLFLTTVALTVLVAEVSFRLYETPFLRLKDYLDRRAQLRESTVEAAGAGGVRWTRRAPHRVETVRDRAES